MYCPICFNNTLKLAHSGVVKVTINGKSKPTSQFIYNLKSDKQEQINNRLKDVLTEYFQWYKTLQNRDLIKNIDLTSYDFICSEGCKISLNHKISVIDLVVPQADFKNVSQQVADEHDISIAL